MLNGSALNDKLNQIVSPGLSDSAYRLSTVPISADVVRKIRFQLGEKGAKFSMERLSLKGKGKWPVAFQDDSFARERNALVNAVDHVLDQQIEGKITSESIPAVFAAIDDLNDKLDRELGVSRDKRYLEAKNRLKELREMTELFKIKQIEDAVGELARYGGTSVNDLRIYMRRHNLWFAEAESPDERQLYHDVLYPLLLQQVDRLGIEKGPYKPAARRFDPKNPE